MSEHKRLIFILASVFWLLTPVTWYLAPAFAQQPTSTAAIFAGNSQYLQGRTWADYKASAGSALTLNVAAGRVWCNGGLVTYAGGTLAMTDSTTNYVYLDTAASCVPAKNVTGLTSTMIPLATVVAAGGAISTVTDTRNLLSASGAESASFTKYATSYAGADAGAKIIACLADVVSASAAICDARGITGAQTATATLVIPDNVTLLTGNMVLTTSASPAVTAGNLSRLIGPGGLSDKYDPGYDGTTIISAGVADPIGFQVRSGSFGGEVRGVRFEGIVKTDDSIGIDVGLAANYIIRGNRTDTFNRGIHLGVDGDPYQCACYNQLYDNQVIHASVGVDFNDSANKNTWHGGNVQPANGGIGFRLGGTQNTIISNNVENFLPLAFAGTALVRSGNVVTATLPSSAAYLPAYAVDYRIYVTDSVDPTFDISYASPVAIATAPDGTHFTYAQTAGDASTTGTVYIGGYAVDIRSSGNEITSQYIESGGTAVKLHNSLVDNNFSGAANTSSLQNYYDFTGVDDATRRDNRIEIGLTNFATLHSNAGMSQHFRGPTGSDYFFLRSGSYFGANGVGGGLSLSYGEDAGAGKYPGHAPFQAKFLRTADTESTADYSAMKGILSTNGWSGVSADLNGVVPTFNNGDGAIGYNYANEQEMDFIADYNNAGKTIAYQWYSRLATGAPALIMSLLRNGTLNTILPIPSSSGGTGNGFTKFTGPTTAEKTFTLPDANATILTTNAAVTVAQVTAALKTRTFHVKIWGTGTAYLLQDADDELTIWRNEIAALTITKVVCECDTGNPTFMLQKDDGAPANMFAAAMTCDATPSGTDGTDGILTSFVAGENAVAATDRIDYATTTAGGAAHWVAITVQYTLD